MNSDPTSKETGNRYSSRIFWIAVTALIGAITTVFVTSIEKSLTTKDYEITVRRIDFDRPEGPQEFTVEIINSGKLPIKDFRIEFRMEVGYNAKDNPVTDDYILSNLLCDSLERVLEEYRGGGWTRYRVSYQCDCLNPGEEMNYYVTYDGKYKEEPDDSHVFGQFGIDVMLKTEGYTYEEYFSYR